MTLSNDPPTLDRDNTKHKYSKTFKEMIDMCLQKDPSKRYLQMSILCLSRLTWNHRPSAEKLLHHPFFKEAKKKEYLVRTVLSRVPPLEQRPHKKVLQRQVSVETTEQWDFDTPATTTADNKQQQQADGFYGIWVVVYGQNEEGCELRERRVYPLRLDVGAVTHCCVVRWCTGRKWTMWNTMRMIISMTLLI